MQKGIDYPAVTTSYMCHDGNGQIVMNKRSKNCRDEHGRWDCGGGSVEFGATIEETLKREIQEEYCAKIIGYHFLGYRDILRKQNGQQTHWISLDFLVHVDRSTVKNGEPHKFDDVQWFSPNNLPTPLHSQLPHFLKKYQTEITSAVSVR